MLKYIFKRLLLMIPVLICVVTIVFTLMYIAPGDPARTMLGENATKESIEAMHKQYGLDKPYLAQLGNYFLNLFKGDMGQSYVTQHRVLDEIIIRFPYTLKLAAGATAVALIIGLSAGIISAVKQYSALDKVFTVIALFGVSAPTFWMAMLCILLFSVRLNWLPPSGSYGFEYWIMPIFICGFSACAYIMRMTRSSMLEVIRQDYIRTARAKGQTEWLTITRHAMKNAFLPILTAIGITIAHLIAGSVLMETVFSLPGIGKFLIDSVQTKDYPCVTGTAVWIAFCCIVINLVVDMIYCLIDPRIKTAYRSGKKKQKPQPAVNAENRKKAGAISG